MLQCRIGIWHSPVGLPVEFPLISCLSNYSLAWHLSENAQKRGQECVNVEPRKKCSPCPPSYSPLNFSQKTNKYTIQTFFLTKSSKCTVCFTLPAQFGPPTLKSWVNDTWPGTLLHGRALRALLLPLEYLYSDLIKMEMDRASGEEQPREAFLHGHLLPPLTSICVLIRTNSSVGGCATFLWRESPLFR